MIIQLPIVACGLFLLAFPLNAATLYVDKDPTCHGLPSCFSTIQAAVDAAEAGDTVWIFSGVYAEHVVVSEKNHRHRAGESDRISIVGGGLFADAVLTGLGTGCGGAPALRIRRSRFVTIRGLTVRGADDAAIVLDRDEGKNTGIHITHNEIYKNGSDGCGTGIVIGRGNTDTLLANNLIHGNSGNGMDLSDDGSADSHYIIENTIDDNGGDGLRTGGHATLLIANNLVTRNGGAGALNARAGKRAARSRAGKVRVLNNLICGNRAAEVTGPLLDEGDSGNLTPTGAEGPGVAPSPGCDDARKVYDWLLGPADGSPAMDAGIDLRTLGLPASLNPILESDIFDDQVRRPQNGSGSSAAFDIGAIEALDLRPKARDGNAATRENTPVLVSLQGRALEPATLAVSVVSGPSHGSLGAVDLFFCAITDNFDRFLAFDFCSWTSTYTPDPSFVGTDTFTYKISANDTDSPPATVTIVVAESQS